MIAQSLLPRVHQGESTITVTSRDPAYVTPSIKAMLRRKNQLMRAGRVEKANALAVQISKDITRRNKKRLCSLNHKTDIKSVWEAVRQVTEAVAVWCSGNSRWS